MTKRRIGIAVEYIVLTIVSVISLFPLFWMLMSATNKSTDVLAGRILPGQKLIENMGNLLKTANVGQAMMNSFKYSVLTTVGSVLICSIAGYAFEVYYTKSKNMVFNLLLISMMIPFAATMIPLYTLFGKLNLLNKTLGFALPSLSTVLLIFLFRQSAQSFPKSIIESARLDGAGELRIFLEFFVPITKHTFTAGITVAFMSNWNNYLWPLIIMQSPTSRTMPQLISGLTSGYVTDYGMLMLAVSISILPTVVVFLILQKNFVEGITGAVK
ncbi:MAG TPA: lactose ABC transporter permease [Clostridiaceae bacterium]|nr:lactose ABC transporter permease [Clostridiaceae bacterium]